jgi:hypothetical protein
MPDEHTYTFRRVLLDVVRSYEPATAGMGDVLTHPKIAMRVEQQLTTPKEVAGAIHGLVERGYLRDYRPGRAPCLRLTPAGRGQLDREESLHEYLWGDAASEFAE